MSSPGYDIVWNVLDAGNVVDVVDVVDDEVVNVTTGATEYTLSRRPAPQVSALFPGHGKLHSSPGTGTLPALKLLPQ